MASITVYNYDTDEKIHAIETSVFPTLETGRPLNIRVQDQKDVLSYSEETYIVRKVRNTMSVFAEGNRASISVDVWVSAQDTGSENSTPFEAAKNTKSLLRHHGYDKVSLYGTTGSKSPTIYLFHELNKADAQEKLKEIRTLFEEYGVVFGAGWSQSPSISLDFDKGCGFSVVISGMSDDLINSEISCEGCNRPVLNGEQYLVWEDDVTTCKDCSPKHDDEGNPVEWHTLWMWNDHSQAPPY